MLPENIGGPPQIWGAKNIKLGPLFPRLPHSTPHISGTKLRRIDKQKCYCQSTMCPLKVDLLSVTFDRETAEIRSPIVTHSSAAITLQPSKLRHVQFLCDLQTTESRLSIWSGRVRGSKLMARRQTRRRLEAEYFAGSISNPATAAWTIWSRTYGRVKERGISTWRRGERRWRQGREWLATITSSLVKDAALLTGLYSQGGPLSSLGIEPISGDVTERSRCDERPTVTFPAKQHCHRTLTGTQTSHRGQEAELA